MFPTPLNDKIWIMVLQIMKRSNDFFTKTKTWHILNARIFYIILTDAMMIFYLTSPSPFILLQIQHLVELIKYSWSLLFITRGWLNSVLVTLEQNSFCFIISLKIYRKHLHQSKFCIVFYIVYEGIIINFCNIYDISFSY